MLTFLKKKKLKNLNEKFKKKNFLKKENLFKKNNTKIPRRVYEISHVCKHVHMYKYLSILIGSICDAINKGYTTNHIVNHME